MPCRWGLHLGPAGIDATYSGDTASNVDGGTGEESGDMAERGAVRSRVWIVWAVVVALVGAGAGAVAGDRWWREHSTQAAIAGEALTVFPRLDRSDLSPVRKSLVDVLEREFAHPRSGPDYAEGAREPWCADFVSWVMREAGVPLANPNSGSWRIPGVYTLQEYYRGVGRFVPIDADYLPSTGDVLLYDAPGPFGQHTNLVLTAANGTVTTIGGNENGTVRIHRFRLSEVPGAVGFGRL